MEPTGAGLGYARSFKLNDFEGPLDLLSYLIRKNEINILDIPIADITEQYLDYLRGAESVDLDNATEFHAEAAWLLWIKSRTLLPAPEIGDDGEPIDPRQELVERLVEYQKFRKLSDLMEDKEREAEWTVERRKLQHSLPFADDGLWEKADIWSLMKTFAALMKHLPSERILDLYEEVSVNEKVALMSELLESKGECLFTDLIVRSNSVMDIVCAFLAILEAVKVRMIAVYQNRMFGDILIKPAEGRPGAAGGSGEAGGASGGPSAGGASGAGAGGSEAGASGESGEACGAGAGGAGADAAANGGASGESGEAGGADAAAAREG